MLTEDAPCYTMGTAPFSCWLLVRSRGLHLPFICMGAAVNLYGLCEGVVVLVGNQPAHDTNFQSSLFIAGGGRVWWSWLEINLPTTQISRAPSSLQGVGGCGGPVRAPVSSRALSLFHSSAQVARDPGHGWEGVVVL